MLGYSQAVRHRVLIPCTPGSNPGSPAIFMSYTYLDNGVARLNEPLASRPHHRKAN